MGKVKRAKGDMGDLASIATGSKLYTRRLPCLISSHLLLGLTRPFYSIPTAHIQGGAKQN